MTSIASVTLDVADPVATQRFHTAAFGLDNGGHFTDPDGFVWEASSLATAK
ncbi:hypothetical protein AB0K35_01695 [Micromonospora sp. NPDC053740]|uniref:hypothetical protein n=1 Tax=Micromonospora sp. NPDC053740 TaxID=3155173 RepID=UPI003439B89B